MADHKYQYRCSNNPRHEVYTNTVATICPCYDKGRPCKGVLERFGPGSKIAAKVDESVQK